MTDASQSGLGAADAPARPVAIDRTVGTEMHALATRLFPITRTLAGPGFRETLDLLETVSGPIERHLFATGEQVLDWEVPREWTLRRAWLKDPAGAVVVDTQQSNLHVVNYSVPVRRRVTLGELQPHLHSLPDQPDAVPYRTSYYKETWGFCLADRVRGSLPDGTYEVFIDTELSVGHLTVGEIIVEGTTDSEILFSTYCCHPSMANNELSGPVLAAFLANRLRARASEGRLRHTYRFVWGPETIGAIAYLSRRGAELARSLVAGWVLTCVGDPGPFTYKRSRRGDALPDRITEHVLRHAGVEHSVVDFFPRGSDERQYCSPGFNLPVGSLMRSMYGTFPEYHTSLDDLSLVTPDALAGSLALYLLVVDVLEANVRWSSTMPYGEPQLGRRGLYPSTGGWQSQAQHMIDMMHLLNFADGTRDLVAIAERGQRPSWAYFPIIEQLRASGLLTDADSHSAVSRSHQRSTDT